MEKKLNIALLVVAVVLGQSGVKADYAKRASYVKPQSRHDAEHAGASPLHDAVIRNDHDTAEALLKSGTVINEKTNGYTPLMLAVRQKDRPMVAKLLEYNAPMTRDQLDKVITESKKSPELDNCVAAVTAKYPSLIINAGIGASNAAHTLETVMAIHTSN